MPSASCCLVPGLQAFSRCCLNRKFGSATWLASIATLGNCCRNRFATTCTKCMKRLRKRRQSGSGNDFRSRATDQNTKTHNHLVIATSPGEIEQLRTWLTPPFVKKILFPTNRSRKGVPDPSPGIVSVSARHPCRLRRSVLMSGKTSLSTSLPMFSLQSTIDCIKAPSAKTAEVKMNQSRRAWLGHLESVAKLLHYAVLGETSAPKRLISKLAIHGLYAPISPSIAGFFCCLKLTQDVAWCTFFSSFH